MFRFYCINCGDSCPWVVPQWHASPFLAAFQRGALLRRHGLQLLSGLPAGVQLFVAVSPEGVQMMADINQYLDFVLKMFLAFGIAFEIPVATFLLAWSGLSTADSMANKRPYVIIGCFVAGMLLTPPDVVSQLLLALPTWLLFEFGILMARFVEKRGTSEENEVDL